MKIFFVLAFTYFTANAFGFERVVALSPLAAEWAAEILGPKIAPKVMVGVSEYSHYPSFLKTVKTVGAYSQIAFEQVLKLNPDLVLASEEYNRPDQINRLKALKLNVATIKKERFHQMKNWILDFGRILHAEAAGKLKAVEWQNAYEALLNKRNTKRTVVIYIQMNPLIVVGGGSFLSEAFDEIGLINVFSNLKEAYPKVSKEAVLNLKPERSYYLDVSDEDPGFEKSKKQVPGLIRLRGDDFARCTLRLLNALKSIE